METTEVERIIPHHELLSSPSLMDIISPNLDIFQNNRLLNYFRNNKDASVIEKFKNVPDFMIRDIFKLFYTHQSDMKIKFNDLNDWWFDNLQDMDNYLMKVVTQDNENYSFVLTKHLVSFLAEEIEKDPDYTDKMQNGSGDDNPDKQQQKRESIRNAMDEAQKEINEQKNMEEMMGGNEAGKEDLMGSEVPYEKIEERMNLLGKISLSRSSIGKLITKSIKSFKKGFSSNFKTFEEEFIDAETIEEINEPYKLLHKTLLSDITITETLSIDVMFDVYVDNSGSMSSGVKYDSESLTRMDLSIALCMRLLGMNLLNDVYEFQNTVNGPLKNINRIFGMRPRGGTSIDAVMNSINSTKKPSVIITDGEDNIHTYSENAFVLLINDSISSRSTDAEKRFIREKRFVQFANNRLFIPKIRIK